MARAWKKKTGSGRSKLRLEPEGKVRQSQAISTYGPGAMMDLLDHAALVSGLDFWRFAAGGVVIKEPRLRDAVDELLRRAGKEHGLELHEPFRLPPAGDDREPTKTVGIPALEFPQWFVCQNPDCRALNRPNGLELKGGKRYHRCDSRKETECVPVRFVMACRRGHLQEFPWVYFAHEKQPDGTCAAPLLRLVEGPTGDFSQVEVRCACGAVRRMADAAVKEANPYCDGHRPWLGPEGTEDCQTEKLRLLVRTASNSYFAQVMSALTIPEQGAGLHDAVKNHWNVLQVATAATLPAFRQIPEIKAALGSFGDDDVLAAIDDVKNARSPARDPLRTAEFKQLSAQPAEKTGDLPAPDVDFFARALPGSPDLPTGVARVVLAHKLREVRVQIGFTRLEPPTPNLQGEFDLGVQAADLGLQTDWFPAAEIRGEGFFLQLDEDAVQEWENRDAVVARGRELMRGFDQWTEQVKKNETGKKPEFPNIRFYLLHSLSHLLMNAVALECGYSASALAERIYCSAAGTSTPMAAILLSTGSPGAEGTLGGLVDQGRRLRAHLRQAWDLGALCSNDPVCAAHSPDGDLAERFLEGAACHGCLFVAECSCERFNRYLDRALVVPTVGHDPALAFFQERP